MGSRPGLAGLEPSWALDFARLRCSTRLVTGLIFADLIVGCCASPRTAMAGPAESTAVTTTNGRLRSAALEGVEPEVVPLPPQPDVEPLPVPAAESLGEETYPIDLPTALALAGANNLQIAFANERIRQAAARSDQARILWIPTLRAGAIYNNHAGRIQATEGDVSEVSRNSVFVGAGAGVGQAPLNGGASGPGRLFVDLPVADVLFEPLAARQLVRAARAEEDTTFNDSLLQVASAYLNLLRAESAVAIAEEAIGHSGRLVKLTEDFARAGEGLQADALRAQADWNNRLGNLPRAKDAVAASSAELTRLIRLDPAVILIPAENQVAPIELFDQSPPLRELISQAQAARPENIRQEAFIRETYYRLRQEQWRPWLPNLYAGFSGGGFGGAPGSTVESFSDRTDFDVAAVWEFQNLGLGNRALQRERQSVHMQAHITAEQFRDLIASEITRTYYQVQYRRPQVELAKQQVTAAAEALALNFEGIRERALRPIEAQQAIDALASARLQYLVSVIELNRSQFELLRALGRPPAL